MNDNLPDQKEYKKYNYKLTPFKLCVLQNFPFIEADFDAITNYQLLCKVVEYLNHVIDNQNTVEDNFKIMADNLNTLYNYLDTLDFQDEVNNKLDEMAEDGTLENIINKVLNATNGTLICNIFNRDCTDWVNGVSEETENAPVKGYFQGMTTTPSSIIYTVQAGGNYENKLNNVYLVEISKSTGTVLKEAFLELYHANSIAYNDTDKEIYVACNSYVNDNDEIIDFNKILIVDYNTFTIKGEATISEDVIDNLENSHIMSVSYDNKNNVLGIGSQNKFFIMDDFETVNRIININYNNTAPLINEIFNNQTNQQIKLFDNRLYQTRYFSNGLVIYNLDGNVVKNYYNFDTDIPIRIGEIESFEIEEDGTIYIASVQRSWTTYRTYALYDRTIFKSNIKVNGYKNYKKPSNSETTGNTYYVDPLTSNNLQVGTQNFPFKSIMQAIIGVEYEDNVSSYIECVSNANYGILIIRNSKFIQINGNNKATFLGCMIEGANTKLMNCIFDLSNDLNMNNNRKNALIEYSKADINNCSFTAENSNTKPNYAITTMHSELMINTCSFNNFVNCLENRNLTNLSIIFTNTFTNCDYKFYNNGMVSIFQNNMNIYNESNPDGVLPSFTSREQIISYTADGNVLTLNNQKTKDLLNTLNFAYDVKIANWTYHFSDTFRKANNRFTNIIKSGNTEYLYLIDIKVDYNNNGTFTLAPIVLQLDIVNGSQTDITSNSEFTWYGLRNAQ